MSEYQYFDFYSVDRTLSREEIEIIRTYSSRVNPNSRRAIFEYNYSDFRYSEEEVLNDFFDVMLYISNWGNRRLLMKFPVALVSFDELKEYEIDASYDYTEGIRVFKKGSNVIVDLDHHQEEGEWVEGEGMLDEMLPLRSQIINGDYRVLYLSWLHLVSENPEMADDLLEPSLPSNLKELDYSLERFINFWEIDWDLISAASKLSESEEILSDRDILPQIKLLSNKEKDQILKELINNEVKAKYELKKRLTELHSGLRESKANKPRTLSNLIAGKAMEHKLRVDLEKQEVEAARIRKMRLIEKEASKMWLEVENNAELKTAKGYDKATEILKDLKEYHDFIKDQVLFDNKLGGILGKYGKSAAFRRRMQSIRIL